MHWSAALSGMFVPGADAVAAGITPVECTSLRELFGEIARQETEALVGAQMDLAAARREERIAAKTEEVTLALAVGGKPPSRRGACRPVVLLYRVDRRTGQPSHTPIDRRTGRPPVFRSVGAAAKYVRQVGSGVSKAIERGGTAGGCAFAYVDQLPTSHVCAAPLPPLKSPPKRPKFAAARERMMFSMAQLQAERPTPTGATT